MMLKNKCNATVILTAFKLSLTQGSHRLGKIKFPDFYLTFPDNFKVFPGILADIYWAGSLTPEIRRSCLPKKLCNHDRA